MADFLSGFGDSLMKNPAVLIGAAPLAMGLFGGQAPSPAEKQLAASAGEAGTQARTLAAYQQSGTLPAGLQSVVDLQSNAAEAAMKSEFAKLGLSNSTMAVEKLGQLKQQKAAEVAQLADSLARQGVDWEKLSAEEWTQVIRAQEVRDTAFQNAFAKFAGALAGGTFNSNSNPPAAA